MAILLSLGASPEPSCPPKEPRTHCLTLALKQPTAKSAAELAAGLQKDGYPLEAEGERVVGWLTQAQLEKLFRTRLRFKQTARSSSDGLACTAELIEPRVPAKYRAVIDALKLDDPACE